MSKFLSASLLMDAYRSFRQEVNFRKVIYFCAALLVVGVFLETYNFVRAVTPTGKFDSELGWVNPPGRYYDKDILYSINEEGFRSKKIDQQKPKIIILGDSIGFGLGVGDQNIFTAYLERQISGYQVLNLSVNGYGLGQYFLLLKREIDKFEPRLVIVIICTGNDIRNTTRAEDYGLSKPIFYVGKDGLELSRKHVSRFSCHNIFSYSWFLKRKPFGWMNQYCSRYFLPVEKKKRVVYQLLRKIYDLGKSRGVETLFVLSPSKSNFDEERSILEFIENAKKKDPENYVQAWLNSSEFHFKKNLSVFRKLFKDSGMAHLDLAKELKGGSIDHNSLFLDHYHFSEIGHKLLASEIKKIVLDLNMLK